VLSDCNNWIRNQFDESTIFSAQRLSTEDTQKLSTEDTQKLSTEDTQRLSTEDTQKLSTEDTQKLSTEDTQRLSTEDTQRLSTEDTQRLSTEDTQKLSTEDTQKLSTEDTQKLSTEDTQKLSTEDTQKLIEIPSDYETETEIQKSVTDRPLAERKKRAPLMAGKATTTVLPFSTSYLCEKAVSSYANLKTKYRNGLHALPDIRLYLPSMVPHYQELSRSKQSHPSH
jgi:hypothetical protein